MNRRYQWPFMSTDPRYSAQPAEPPADESEEESPYCRCDNLPTLEEIHDNKCFSCGRPLK